ncbi:MAG: PAS domain-containing protein, partial [Oscillospiraceae bacterium]
MINKTDPWLLESISHSIMVREIPPSFPCYFVGRRVLDFLGYTHEEDFYHDLGESITGLIHPDDSEFVSKRVKEQLDTFGQYAIEYRVKRKDGSYIWIQDRGTKIVSPQKKPMIISTFYTLPQSNAAGIFDDSSLFSVCQSTHGIYVVEKDSHKLLYANKAMEDILASEGICNFLGQKCHCVLRHKSHPCDECIALLSPNTSDPQEIYLDFLSKYYSVISHSIEWRGAPAYVIYISDISKDKAARIELAKTKQKLTAAINHTGLVYWEYDILSNKAFFNTVSVEEYNLSEMLEDYPASLYAAGAIHPDSIECYNSLIQRVKEGAATVKADIKTINSNGDLVWKRVRFTTLFNDKGKPFWAIATAENINEFKDLESRFATVLEQNQIDTWMYDIGRHTIIQNHNTEAVYGINGAEIPNVPESLIAKNQCYYEDVEKFKEFYSKLHKGTPQVCTTVRLWDARTKSYVWKRCTYTILPSRSKKPVYALGSAVEVTDQMETKQKYE